MSKMKLTDRVMDKLEEVKLHMESAMPAEALRASVSGLQGGNCRGCSGSCQGSCSGNCDGTCIIQ